MHDRYGRTSVILELYVPSLECGFNDSAGWCQSPGNVVDSCRGRLIKTVKLSDEQYETLREWRDIVLDYRKREEIARQRALETCFGAFKGVSYSERYEHDWEFRGLPFEGTFRPLPRLEQCPDSDYSENFMKTLFYQLAGLRRKPLVVQILIESEQQRYNNACKIQRNLRKLFYLRHKHRSLRQPQRRVLLLLTDSNSIGSFPDDVG